jgi:hypothetical protein
MMHFPRRALMSDSQRALVVMGAGSEPEGSDWESAEGFELDFGEVENVR